MISGRQVLELVNAEPFQPFTIHTSSGRPIRVTHPEQVTALPRKLVVATGYKGKHQAEGLEHISYLHITSLEERQGRSK
jgi:hypothetical protein